MAMLRNGIDSHTRLDAIDQQLTNATRRLICILRSREPLNLCAFNDDDTACWHAIQRRSPKQWKQKPEENRSFVGKQNNWHNRIIAHAFDANKWNYLRLYGDALWLQLNHCEMVVSLQPRWLVANFRARIAAICARKLVATPKTKSWSKMNTFFSLHFATAIEPDRLSAVMQLFWD